MIWEEIDIFSGRGLYNRETISRISEYRIKILSNDSIGFLITVENKVI